MIKAPKKLIEVALPLDDINNACVKESSPFTPKHPRSLHIWWARRRLAAVRAVLFAQLVNDPGGERGWGKYPGQTKEDAQNERERLFSIIRELVKWENTNNKELLKIVREEIIKSWQETCNLNKGKFGFDPDKLPAIHDPFAGGGAIPLEAQRLGLDAYASDLNPVSVVINKAMIEIPPRFSERAPVGPEIASKKKSRKVGIKWDKAAGIAEDILRYGHLLNNSAYEKMKSVYEDIVVTKDMVSQNTKLKDYLGDKLPVVAWIWARTVKSPNPAFSHVEVPLVSTFVLSSQKGKEVWLSPEVDGDRYKFVVKYGTIPSEAKNGTKEGRGAHFRCIVSGSPIEPDYIKQEGQQGRLKSKLLAIVLEGNRCRLYTTWIDHFQSNLLQKKDAWKPSTQLPDDPRNFWTPSYGLNTFGDLFTDRQLSILDVFGDLLARVKDRVVEDAISAGWGDDGIPLENGGDGATAYGDAIITYLALSISRWTDLSNSLTSWNTTNQNFRALFSRQAIPMAWDYAEVNPFGPVGCWYSIIESYSKLFENIPSRGLGSAVQCDAASAQINDAVVSTDPPYYDNISYADLSDFFYVWLRRFLKPIYPKEFATITVPKAEELIASPYRHGGKKEAEEFFMNGMENVLLGLADKANKAFPLTIYYAFKQSETKEKGTTSTGWETFLEATVKAGLLISGTWPVRTERNERAIGIGTNALASSIVLVCRKRDENAPSIPRRQFLRELKEELPESLESMIGGKKGASPIAPVDLAQASIGPGMAVFSRYSGIIEADGSKMSVHDALIQINKVIDEFFNEAEGDMDSDTRFCIDWFMQYGFKQADYGQADVLARAKGTTVEGLAVAGVVETGGGEVRLLKFEEYPENWDPEKDNRTPTWEALHQLIRALRSGGEAEAGLLLKKMAERTESIRQLAYRLYTLCERKGWAEEARAYNELIASWHGTIEAAEQSQAKSRQAKQLTLDM